MARRDARWAAVPAPRAGRALAYVLLCFWWVGAKLGRFFLVPPTLLAARGMPDRPTATAARARSFFSNDSEAVGQIA